MTDMTTIATTKDDLLVVVDPQNDFVTGPLGSEWAKKLALPIAEFIADFNGTVAITMDTHGKDYLDTQKGRNLPVPHTIKGTWGWQLIPEVSAVVRKEHIILQKDTFGSLDLAELVRNGHFRNIYFLGFDTCYCVISNAVIAKAADPEAVIHIIKCLCACATPETHELGIGCMRTLQMDIIE